MVKLINYLPPHVAGVYAYADVSEAEYAGELIPLLDTLIEKNNKINFILILETNIANFKLGAWYRNIKIGFKYFFKWNKVAIVTDQQRVPGYNDLFKYIIPGKFRRFPLDQLDKAIRWVSANNGGR